jgi:hypothetical protein
VLAVTVVISILIPTYSYYGEIRDILGIGVFDQLRKKDMQGVKLNILQCQFIGSIIPSIDGLNGMQYESVEPYEFIQCRESLDKAFAQACFDYRSIVNNGKEIDATKVNPHLKHLDFERCSQPKFVRYYLEKISADKWFRGRFNDDEQTLRVLRAVSYDDILAVGVVLKGNSERVRNYTDFYKTSAPEYFKVELTLNPKLTIPAENAMYHTLYFIDAKKAEIYRNHVCEVAVNAENC